MNKILITFISAALIYSLIPVPSGCADKAYRANERGVEAFAEKNYAESAELFTQALVEQPDSPDLKFNLGTALSAQNKKDAAVKQLENAAVEFDDQVKSAAALYNAGNTCLAGDDLDNAISYYKNALKLDQQSEDIRYNLEFAMRKKQEQEQQQQNKEENQENKDNKDQDNKDQSEDSDKKNDEEEKKDEDRDQDSETENQDEEQQQDQQDQQSQQQDSENQQMSPEEAKRILDALSDEEKKALSLKKMKMKMEMKQGDDW